MDIVAFGEPARGHEQRLGASGVVEEIFRRRCEGRIDERIARRREFRSRGAGASAGERIERVELQPIEGRRVEVGAAQRRDPRGEIGQEARISRHAAPAFRGAAPRSPRGRAGPHRGLRRH
jgi:hypothetical protein